VNAAPCRLEDLDVVTRTRAFERVLPAASVALVASVLVLDFINDLAGGELELHDLGEVLGIVVAMTGLLLMWRMVNRSRAEARQLRAVLDGDRADLERCRRHAAGMRCGVDAYVHRQLDALDLSPGEREIAVLLLRRLSLEAIAEARRVSFSKVHEQAVAVYRKAGVDGPAELAARLVEGILLPVGPAAASRLHALPPPDRTGGAPVRDAPP
jgi:hypothetical protein